LAVELANDVETRLRGCHEFRLDVGRPRIVPDQPMSRAGRCLALEQTSL
jgi:hypothetical protein